MQKLLSKNAHDETVSLGITSTYKRVHENAIRLLPKRLCRILHKLRVVSNEKVYLKVTFRFLDTMPISGLFQSTGMDYMVFLLFFKMKQVSVCRRIISC